LLWILNMRGARKHAGLVSIGSGLRDYIAD